MAQVEERLERAPHLWLEGELAWQGFMKTRDEAEVALAGIYVPAFDEAVEADNSLADFPMLWQVGRRDRLLRMMLDAIYVGRETKRLMGLAPKRPAWLQLYPWRPGKTCLWWRKMVAVYWGWWRRGRVELPVQKAP